MKAVIRAKKLNDVLITVGKAVHKSSGLPMLRQYKIQASPGKLEVTGSDLETMLIKSEITNVEGEAAFVIESALFRELTGYLTGDLELLHEDGILLIKSKEGTYKIPTLEVGEYPDFYENISKNNEDVSSFKISGQELRKALKFVFFAINNVNEDNVHKMKLAGSYWDMSEEGKIIFVGTDGHRLARYRVEVPEKIDSPIMASGRSTDILKDILPSEEVTIKINNNVMSFEFEGMKFVCRLMNSKKFPEYKSIYPKDYSYYAKILDTKNFITGVSRLKKLDRENNKLFVKYTKGKVTMSLEGREVDEGLFVSGTEEHKIVYEGLDFEIAYNIDYFEQVLKHIPDNLYIKMTAENKPTILCHEDEEKDILLMPMRK